MITIIIGLLLIAVFYWYGTKNYKYWEEKGIKHEKPIPFFGNNARQLFLRKSFTQITDEFYWKYVEEKVVGFYLASRPALIVRDPEITKRILTTDFIHFHVRTVSPYKNLYPFQDNLFFADGDTWRLVRQRVTPAFTSSKLRAMFPLIIECAEKLQHKILNAASKGHVLDAHDTMARFTTDFIGACGFGLETDALTDENSPFRRLGKKMFDMSLKQIFIYVLKVMFPELMQYVKTRGDLEKDVFSLVNGILRARNYRPSGRHDFIDLLLECRNKGTMVGVSIEHFEPDGTPKTAELEFDDMLIAAQIFIFFAAGFETSSLTSSYALHQLAHNPDKQKNAQEEIDRVLDKYSNKLCYEAVKEMTYLECCFKEGMRMFPSVGFLTRQCVGKYTIPEIDLTIDKGVQIIVPVQAMQNDPQYFENPEQYRPERFLPDKFDSRNKYMYLPFGLGPRACIGRLKIDKYLHSSPPGERLGLMQSLAGLAAVLSCTTVKPGPTSVRNPPVDLKNPIVQAVKGGLPLIFHKREKLAE